MAASQVIELHLGGDEKIHSVTIKKGDGSVELGGIKHPYPMELFLTHNDDAMEPSSESSQH